MQIRKEEDHHINIFGDCPGATYPLDEKEHTMNIFREIAHSSHVLHLWELY